MTAQLDLDPRVRAAARRAVREDGALPVLLFGSRARGDARPDSDTDLAILGNGRLERAEDGLRRRLGPHIDIDVIARDLQDFLENTHAGTAWGDIVREGKVIAGQIKGLRQVTVMPVPGQRIMEILTEECIDATRCCINAVADMREVEGILTSNTRPTARHSAYAAEHTFRVTIACGGVRSSAGPWLDDVRAKDPWTAKCRFRD